MRTMWIKDGKSPDGVKECQVYRYIPSFMDDSYKDRVISEYYELIYSTDPILFTVKCMNKKWWDNKESIWKEEKEVFETKEEALNS